MAPKRKRDTDAIAARATKPRLKREVEDEILPICKPLKAKMRQQSVCGACLMPVDQDDQIGLIDGCDHFFHYECVERWSQTENSCPQCKLRFSWLASYTPKGQRENLVRVRRRDQKGEEDEVFEDIVVCEKCKQVGDEASLLLCDGMHGTCNSAYHCACVGLIAVPRDSWFCEDCVERGFDIDAAGRRGNSAASSSNASAVLPEEIEAASVPARLRNPSSSSTAEDGAASVAARLCGAPLRRTSAAPAAKSRAAISAAAAAAAAAERRAATSAAAAAAAESRAAASAAAAVATAASSSAEPTPAAPSRVAAALAEAEAAVMRPALLAAAAARSTSHRSNASASMPPQLRLSSLACMTPAVEAPTFLVGGSASAGPRGATPTDRAEQEPAKENIFASFAARRRAKRQSEAANTQQESSTPRFCLNPAYEEDFMGRTVK